MLTFETPFHDMCSTHRAILHKLDQTCSIVYFDEVGMSQCPDIIITEDGRFRYAGTQDGQASYVEEEVEAK